MVVKRDYKCVRIPIDDILFVDCDKDYIRFHLEGRPNIRTLGNLKQLEERLPKEKFKRVHRSFLANMTKFDTVDQQHRSFQRGGSPKFPQENYQLESQHQDLLLQFI